MKSLNNVTKILINEFHSGKECCNTCEYQNFDFTTAPCDTCECVTNYKISNDEKKYYVTIAKAIVKGSNKMKQSIDYKVENKKVYELQLFEWMEIDQITSIRKVPNGFIYTTSIPEYNILNETFIPEIEINGTEEPKCSIYNETL